MKLEVIAAPELLAFGKPAFATDGSAAIDLRALLNTPSSRDHIAANLGMINSESTQDDEGQWQFRSITIAPGAQIALDSGLKIHINSRSHCGLVLPRSSSGKRGLVLANGTGLIDSDYQGPLTLMLWNRSSQNIKIVDGERVAQYLLTTVFQFDLNFVDAFSGSSERGEGGFGSTGTH